MIILRYKLFGKSTPDDPKEFQEVNCATFVGSIIKLAELCPIPELQCQAEHWLEDKLVGQVLEEANRGKFDFKTFLVRLEDFTESNSNLRRFLRNDNLLKIFQGSDLLDEGDDWVFKRKQNKYGRFKSTVKVGDYKQRLFLLFKYIQLCFTNQLNPSDQVLLSNPRKILGIRIDYSRDYIKTNVPLAREIIVNALQEYYMYCGKDIPEYLNPWI